MSVSERSVHSEAENAPIRISERSVSELLSRCIVARFASKAPRRHRRIHTSREARPRDSVFRALADAVPPYWPDSMCETVKNASTVPPSTAEDTFFFSPDEIEDYRRDKRRRVIHEDRQARLRALHVEAPNDDQPPADPREDWGGSDEEVEYYIPPRVLVQRR